MFFGYNEHVAWVSCLKIHEDDASLVLQDNACGTASFDNLAEYAITHKGILGQPDEEVHFFLGSKSFSLCRIEAGDASPKPHCKR